jgi:hypothetical protein
VIKGLRRQREGASSAQSTQTREARDAVEQPIEIQRQRERITELEAQVGSGR